MNKIIIVILLLVSIAIPQGIRILDNDGNETLLITDEGITGSITIPEVGVTLGTTEQKLYQSHARLVWDGSILGTDEERGWSDGGTTVRLKTITDNVGIGFTSATNKLDVAGTVNSPDNYKIDGLTFLKNSHSTMLIDFGTIIGSDAGNNYIGYSDHKIDAIGYRALYSLVDGTSNTAIGWKALHNILDEERNTAIGYSAASNQTEYGNTTAIGSLVLAAGNITSSNTGIGAFTFNEEEDGRSSTAIGTNALMKNKVGGGDSYNTAIGADCLKNNTTGNHNVGIGYKALEGIITGSNNVAIGYKAGNPVDALGSSNSGNIFIGSEVATDTSGSLNNQLWIDNSNTNQPLIWGDFTDGSEKVRINGDLEYTGTITHVSDISLKENVESLDNTIEKVQRINGVSFDWNDEAKNSLVVNDVPQIGVIAQEVEKVYPEIVKINNLGYKTVDYSKLSVILIEVLKEQQFVLKNLEDYFNEIERKI